DGARAGAEGPGVHGRRAGQRQLVLSAFNSSQQHISPELRALPRELHTGVLQQYEQSGTMGGHAAVESTNQVQRGLNVSAAAVRSSTQKKYFKANCMIRGSRADVT